MKRLLGVLVLLCLACRPAAPPPDPALASATRFVQTFYAWYVPSAKNGSGIEIGRRDSTALFAPALVTALQADAAAQAKTPGEVVGLDWDPFLAAQDYCDTYDIGAARHEAQDVLVDVRGKCWQAQDTLPDVVAEVGPSGGAWVFVNFRYPRDTSDLLKDLDALRRARAPHPAARRR